MSFPLDQNVTQRTTIRGRKAVKPMIEEEIYEPGTEYIS